MMCFGVLACIIIVDTCCVSTLFSEYSIEKFYEAHCLTHLHPVIKSCLNDDATLHEQSQGGAYTMLK